MTKLIHRFRAPLIAVLALVFSASMVAAGQPASPASSGLEKAASHAGKTVPVNAGDETNETDESSESDDTDSSDSADNCTVDLTGDLSGFSHGQIVCTAAHMATPDGYDNHGAWVSHWAKTKGAEASATGKSHKPSH